MAMAVDVEEVDIAERVMNLTQLRTESESPVQSEARLSSGVIRQLVLADGTCGEDDAVDPTALVLSASGAAAVEAMAEATTASVQASHGGCRYDWRDAGIQGFTWHLWLHIGGRLPIAPIAPVPSRTGHAVFLDLGHLALASSGCEPAHPTERLLARAARDIAEAILVRGHVCVDFEDVAVILPQVSGLTIAYGAGRDRVAQACTGLRLRQRVHIEGGGAFVIITFPSGGGKLMESKRAINFVREQLGPAVGVIYATTIDPQLNACTVRITVLG